MSWDNPEAPAYIEKIRTAMRALNLCQTEPLEHPGAARRTRAVMQ